MPAARSKNMTPPLHSGFVRGACERLELFLIPLNLAGLRHFVDKVRDEQLEALLLLALQQGIAYLIALGGKIGVSRLLVLDDLKNCRIAAAVDRAADFSRLHGERHRGL